MKNSIKTLLIFIFLLMAMAFKKEEAPVERVSILARIDAIQKGSMGYPLKAKDQKIEKLLHALKPEEEVILEGHITYQKSQQDTVILMNPTFVIENVRPISLKKLGRMDDFKVEERPVNFQLGRGPYGPKGIHITPELAGAITITASVLLLKSLASAKGEPKYLSSYSDTTIFSAGALATGVLILDQIKKSTP